MYTVYWSKQTYAQGLSHTLTRRVLYDKTVYIGMAVNSANYTLNSYTCKADNCSSIVKLGPDMKNMDNEK